MPKFGTYVVKIIVRETVADETGPDASRVGNQLIETINEHTELFISGDIMAKCIAVSEIPGNKLKTPEFEWRDKGG